LALMQANQAEIEYKKTIDNFKKEQDVNSTDLSRTMLIFIVRHMTLSS
jgi:hypothetical protein